MPRGGLESPLTSRPAAFGPAGRLATQKKFPALRAASRLAGHAAGGPRASQLARHVRSATPNPPPPLADACQPNE